MTGTPLEGAGAGAGDGSGTGFTAGEEGRIGAGAGKLGRGAGLGVLIGGTGEAGMGRTTAGEDRAGVEGRLGIGATADDGRGVADAAGCEAGTVAGLKIWNRTNRLSAPQH
jgi:hypothetical protein